MPSRESKAKAARKPSAAQAVDDAGRLAEELRAAAEDLPADLTVAQRRAAILARRKTAAQK